MNNNLVCRITGGNCPASGCPNRISRANFEAMHGAQDGMELHGTIIVIGAVLIVGRHPLDGFPMGPMPTTMGAAMDFEGPEPLVDMRMFGPEFDAEPGDEWRRNLPPHRFTSRGIVSPIGVWIETLLMRIRTFSLRAPRRQQPRSGVNYLHIPYGGAPLSGLDDPRGAHAPERELTGAPR